MGVALNEKLPILALIHPQPVGWAFSQYPPNGASQYLFRYAEAQCAWLAQIVGEPKSEVIQGRSAQVARARRSNGPLSAGTAR